MERFKWLYKIPVKIFLIVYLVLSFVMPLLFLSLNIDKKSPVIIAFYIPSIFCFILLVIRFLNYLKAKGSSGYYIIKLFLGYILIFFPAVLFITVDINQGLNGLLMIPGLALEAGFLIWLLVRYLKKRWKKEHAIKEASSSSYSFEKLCDDFSTGREIEFTYNNEQYLYIYENGRYYFKRIIAVDPYEYEILSEAGNALVCIGASAVNGKNMTVIWPDIDNITAY